jgi:hypothetical protein
LEGKMRTIIIITGEGILKINLMIENP